MDVVTDCDLPHCAVESTLLIEGDLDGAPTGRTVGLVTGPAYTGPGITYDRGVPNGLAYDAGAAGGTGLFYYVDAVNEDRYAIGIDGEVVEGYPVPQTDYDPGGQLSMLQAGFDAVHGPDGGAYLETTFALESEGEYGGIVVADPWGDNTGVETPLDLLYAPDGEGEVISILGLVRSRADSSVLYVTAFTGTTGPPTGQWVVAIRAHPLPPRWLRVAPVAPLSLELVPGEADTVTVKIDTEGLAPGVYEGQVALRDGGPNGEEAIAVPITLTVTEGTNAEDGATPEVLALTVYPNPSAGEATVTLSPPAPETVRVAVFDVLGREVVMLHDGPLASGSHRLALDASGLPAGLYVVRVTSDAFTAAQRLTLVR